MLQPQEDETGIFGLGVFTPAFRNRRVTQQEYRDQYNELIEKGEKGSERAKALLKRINATKKKFIN